MASKTTFRLRYTTSKEGGEGGIGLTPPLALQPPLFSVIHFETSNVLAYCAVILVSTLFLVGDQNMYLRAKRQLLSDMHQTHAGSFCVASHDSGARSGTKDCGYLVLYDMRQTHAGSFCVSTHDSGAHKRSKICEYLMPLLPLRCSSISCVRAAMTCPLSHFIRRLSLSLSRKFSSKPTATHHLLCRSPSLQLLCYVSTDYGKVPAEKALADINTYIEVKQVVVRALALTT